MKYFLLILIVLFLAIQSEARDDGWSWWNSEHGWEEGMPGWRNWLIISPEFLGPNALPVPEVKKGFLKNNTELEFRTSAHFYPGDPTQDLSGRVYLPFADGRIAIELFGVFLEHYNYTEQIRNERFSRDRDGKGITVGDLNISTMVQLVKDRKFPNTLLRINLRTASGEMNAARYSDAPGYYFDLSFSKDFGTSEKLLIRPIGMIGFYCWQTNDESFWQNDAPMYGLGAEFIRNKWAFTATWSGYNGYKNNGDSPQQLSFDMVREMKNTALKVQYEHGMQDWLYKTVRFSFIWKLNPVKYAR